MKLGGAISVPYGAFGGVLGIGPQRVVVADALAEAQDREPRRVLVVEARLGAQLGADQRPHVGQHLVGELAARQLVGDAGVGAGGGLGIGHLFLLFVYMNHMIVYTE